MTTSPHSLGTLLSILRDPITGEPLRSTPGTLTAGARTYPLLNDIPCLLHESSRQEIEAVRQSVQTFYEHHAFPGYDLTDTPATLRMKAERSHYAIWLDRSISKTATVLDAGCGTGQMANFLGLKKERTVIGVDMSLASLREATKFRNTYHLQNVHFVQANIFALPFAAHAFDVIICQGVLHHTPAPEEALKELVRTLRPRGYIVLGLYHRFARIPHILRTRLARIVGHPIAALDTQLQRRDIDANRKERWIADQYEHPYESRYTIDDVLAWFEHTGIAFRTVLPTVDAHDIPGHAFDLFAQHSIGSTLGRTLRQISWAFTHASDGGFFTMIGQKDFSTRAFGAK